MIDILNKSKDKIKNNKDSEQIKEDKHLVKIASINPHKGHQLFKVVNGEIINVEPGDYIESRIYLNYIGKDVSFSYKTFIKMKEGRYISALNKSTAIKQL